jgi:hypothetical protein
MSAPFDYYADADKMPVLDYDALDLSEEQKQAVREIVANTVENPELMAVRAAHVFERKGFFSTNDFAGNQNDSYRRAGDDIVVQVTVVIRAEQKADYATMEQMYGDVQAAKHAAEVAAQEAAVADAQARLAAAQERLAAVQNG